MCQRLFGSMYGSTERHIRCLRALKKKPRQDSANDRSKLNPFKTRLKGSRNQVGRQQYRPFADLTEFSQDYLDVNDLARSKFANDYVDVNDLREGRSIVPNCKSELGEFGRVTQTNCLPVSRKSHYEGNSRFNVEDSALEGKFDEISDVKGTSNSNELYEKDNTLRFKKKKRYKVVSNEKSSDSDDSSKSYDFDKHGSGSSLQSSDSNEVTTKKPKKNKKNKASKKESSDSYMYMQGNKMYNQDDFRKNKWDNLKDEIESANEEGSKHARHRFRRGIRLPHFLPKRYHWDEEEFQNLGYYWFNGPKGKYKIFEA